MLHNSI